MDDLTRMKAARDRDIPRMREWLETGIPKTLRDVIPLVHIQDIKRHLDNAELIDDVVFIDYHMTVANFLCGLIVQNIENLKRKQIERDQGAQ